MSVHFFRPYPSVCFPCLHPACEDVSWFIEVIRDQLFIKSVPIE